LKRGAEAKNLVDFMLDSAEQTEGCWNWLPEAGK
jgi:hypothetical protein